MERSDSGVSRSYLLPADVEIQSYLRGVVSKLGDAVADDHWELAESHGRYVLTLGEPVFDFRDVLVCLEGWRDVDGVRLLVRCPRPGGYALFLKAIGACTGAVEVRRAGVPLDTPRELLLTLRATPQDCVRWLYRTVGREVGWIESEEIGYYALALRSRPGRRSGMYDVVCHCVCFGPWCGSQEYSLFSFTLVAVTLKRLDGSKTECRLTWCGDGGPAPFLQVATAFLRHFGVDEDVASQVQHYESWAAAWQDHLPAADLTLGATYLPDVDGPQLEARPYTCLLYTSELEYRDWLVIKCDAVSAVEQDLNNLWLRHQSSIQLWPGTKPWFEISGREFAMRQDLPSHGRDDPPYPWVGGSWLSRISGESPIPGIEDGEDTLLLEKSVYWAEVRTHQGEDGLEVTVTPWKTTASDLAQLGAMRQASVDRFGGLSPLKGPRTRAATMEDPQGIGGPGAADADKADSVQAEELAPRPRPPKPDFTAEERKAIEEYLHPPTGQKPPTQKVLAERLGISERWFRELRDRYEAEQRAKGRPPA